MSDNKRELPRHFPGFEHEGTQIVNPTASDCGRFEASPEDYGFVKIDRPHGSTAWSKIIDGGAQVIVSSFDGTSHELPSRPGDPFRLTMLASEGGAEIGIWTLGMGVAPDEDDAPVNESEKYEEPAHEMPRFFPGVEFDGENAINPTAVDGGSAQSLRNYGFEMWDTGGGFTAWGKRLSDGTEILLTNLDGDSHELGEPGEPFAAGLRVSSTYEQIGIWTMAVGQAYTEENQPENETFDFPGNEENARKNAARMRP